jgi:hypothetical protein
MTMKTNKNTSSSSSPRKSKNELKNNLSLIKIMILSTLFMLHV